MLKKASLWCLQEHFLFSVPCFLDNPILLHPFCSLSGVSEPTPGKKLIVKKIKM